MIYVNFKWRLIILYTRIIRADIIIKIKSYNKKKILEAITVLLKTTDYFAINDMYNELK